MNERLAASLGDAGRRLGRSSALLLPDLFIDHLVPVPGRAHLDKELERLLGQGGGNMLLSPQQTKLGGNAANTAFALARLGVPSTLVTMTDPVGRVLWERAVDGLPADARGVKVGQGSSTTVALELQEENANVMMSDPGPLSDLGPDDLDAEVWDWVAEADLVVVTNWAQTLDHGTALFHEVVSRARAAGAFTFLDTGDPAHHPAKAWDLLDSGLFQELSAWGVNEHEARFFAGRLLDREPALVTVEEALGALAHHTRGYVDLHTHTFGLSQNGDEVTRVPSFPVKPMHRTGAGDAWNAGDLAGYLLGLSARDRLTLAHAVATLTIGGAGSGPPTMPQVVAFLNEN